MSQQPQIPQPPQDAARLEAIEALTARMHFRRHLMTYVFVNIILWVIWLLAPGARGGSSFPWPLWSTLGWGFAVLMQWQRLNASGITEAQIEAEMRKRGTA